MDNEKEIDLTKIDWNILTSEEYSRIEKKIQDQHKEQRKNKPRKKYNNEFKIVKIHGKEYQIKAKEYERYMKLKSQKAKDKFISKIISSQNPIEEL